ncbi:tetratricopeptide repeat protein [Macrococcus capreoli]|uniref:tetratricopeptide repeat protein n=1 Tax=Macrococcus capreoli TaxID=2982690 RepID=UPI003EE48D73
MDYNEKIDNVFMLFEEDNKDEAIKLLQEIGNTVKQGDAHYSDYLLNAAYIYAADNHFDKARETLRSLLESDDAEDRQMAHHQLGLVERMDAEFDQSIEHFKAEQALINEHFADDTIKQSVNLYELGYVQLLNSQYDEGKASLESSLKLAELSEDDLSIAISNRALGELYAAQEEMDKAKQYFNEAKRYFRKDGDEFGVAEIEALEAAIF